MFIGEINYQDTFAPNLRGLPPTRLVALGFLLIAFIILLNVTLANLLVSIADHLSHALFSIVTILVHFLILQL